MGEGRKQDIPEALRWAVWERDDFRCHYCGARAFLSIDHVQPEIHGGPASMDNLVTACRRCNSRKGTNDYADYLRRDALSDAGRRMLWDRLDYREEVFRLERWRAELDRRIRFLVQELDARYPVDCGRDGGRW